MLLRLANRASSGHGRIVPITLQGYQGLNSRPYAADARTGRQPQNGSNNPQRSPQDQTWRRDTPLRFEAKSSPTSKPRQEQIDGSSRDAYTPQPTEKAGSSASPGDVQDQKGDYSVQQPEFESTASSQGGKDADVEHAPSGSELGNEDVGTSSKLRKASQPPSEAQEGGKPSSAALPDLRRGIPSTFAQDFSDRSSSFRDKETESSELNLTEDTGSGAGRGRDNADLDGENLTSIERRRLRFARYLYIIAAALGTSGAILLGQNWANEEEARKHPAAPNGFSIGAIYNRIKARTAESLGFWLDPAFPELLPDQHPDYIPPGTPTLVLSLEDLLVHSNWSRERGWQVAKRPGVDYFLRYLSQYYELVIFTTVSRMNAEMVILKLDPFRVVQWPLYREATRFVNGQPVKVRLSSGYVEVLLTRIRTSLRLIVLFPRPSSSTLCLITYNCSRTMQSYYPNGAERLVIPRPKTLSP